ncbi:hypothetical protein Tco_0343839 [Tanacetum coccineum]
MPPRMTTRSAGRATAAPQGGRTVPDFSTIIAQQLQNLLLTIIAQVGSQGSDQGNGRNQSGDAVNDNIRGDVRNVIENNDHRGCTYKEFLACNLKEYDGKGGAIVDLLLLPWLGVQFTWGDKEVTRLTWWPRVVMEVLGCLLGDMVVRS